MHKNLVIDFGFFGPIIKNHDLVRGKAKPLTKPLNQSVERKTVSDSRTVECVIDEEDFSPLLNEARKLFYGIDVKKEFVTRVEVNFGYDINDFSNSPQTSTPAVSVNVERGPTWLKQVFSEADVDPADVILTSQDRSITAAIKSLQKQWNKFFINLEKAADKYQTTSKSLINKIVARLKIEENISPEYSH